jgi:UDP-N-acetyl-2-amino-2-deoxyglucuronate dehydrogenase
MGESPYFCEMKSMRFVVIGLGHIGSRHAETLRMHPEAQWVASVDPDRTKATVGIPHFGSWDEFLNSGIACDAASIASPNGLHAEQAIQAMKAGLHVVVEKPMALSAADVRSMIQVSEQTGKSLIGVMQNRYSAPSQYVKSLLDQGALGTLYRAQVDCFWNRDERYYAGHAWHGSAELDGGVLFTQFSHFVDMLHWLLGPLQPFWAESSNHNHQGITPFDDSGSIAFAFGSTGRGSFRYSTSVSHQNFESTLSLIGERGTIKLGGQYMNQVQYVNIDGQTITPELPEVPANDYGLYKGSAANHHHLIQNALDHLLRGAPITTPAQDGLAVVEFIEKAHALAHSS